MKNTLIVTSSNRHMEQCTHDAIGLAIRHGARHIRQSATADVTFARNHALTMACSAIRQVEEAGKLSAVPPLDVVLMVDDDMEFSLESAEALVAAARQRGRPCSALYVTINQRPAATKWRREPNGRLLYLVGLGLLAIPAPVLLGLEAKSPVFKYGERGDKLVELREFCVSGNRDGHWISEDFSLCEGLGGVHLLPIEAGHRKTLTLWPQLATVEELRKEDADAGSNY